MHRVHHLLRGVRAGDSQHLGVYLSHQVAAVVAGLGTQAAGDDDLAIGRQRFADGVQAFLDRVVSRNGWERANYFKTGGDGLSSQRPAHVLGKPGWLPWVIAEQRATREAVALYDQTSFGKLLLQGLDALAVLRQTCCSA